MTPNFAALDFASWDYPTRSSARRAPSRWRAYWHELFDAYRPEQHYMRGPGPKSHAKHVTGTFASAAHG